MRSLLVSPIEFWRGLVRCVALAADERSAYVAIAREISRALDRRTWLVEKSNDHFGIIAAAGGAAPDDIRDLLTPAATTSFDEQPTPGAVESIDLGQWTAIKLGDEDHASVLIVAGERATLEPLLGAVAVWLPSALASVRERALRAGADAFAVDAYRLARRASRLGAPDAICQRAVEQASRSLSAQRVAIALEQACERRLGVMATHGYPLATVKDVRIEPGEWVMGHVFESKRAIAVRDVRRLRAMSIVARRYRTFSFAAVPIVAERRVIGVLSATDKADGTSFTRRDLGVLRAISGVAALGLVAARGEADARRLARAATIDSLTDVFNRQLFDVRLHQEVERAKRTSSMLTVLLIDVDDFKVINDTHGHAVGDAVLQAVASILRSMVRVFDVCARYGGDEFAVVMPNCSSASAAASAERIREHIASNYNADGRLTGLSRVTVSIGVAIMDGAEAPEQVLRRADESLYQAKAGGKNCVRMSSSRRGVPLSNLLRSGERG